MDEDLIKCVECERVGTWEGGIKDTGAVLWYCEKCGVDFCSDCWVEFFHDIMGTEAFHQCDHPSKTQTLLCKKCLQEERVF